MFRRPAFLRAMTRLAWLAVVLMVVMPSASRVLAASAPPAWTEVCSADGHGGPGLPAGAHADADCGYCLLGAPLPLSQAAAPPLPPRPATALGLPADPPPRAWRVRLSCLGSRAPPLPL